MLKEYADKKKTGDNCMTSYTQYGGRVNILADEVYTSDIYDLCQYVKHLEASSRELDRIRRVLVIDRYQEP